MSARDIIAIMKRAMFALGVAALTAVNAFSAGAQQIRFRDDFESGLRQWEVRGGHAITIVESGDSIHRRVLQLSPDGWDVFALIRGSGNWGRVRVEGDVLFRGIANGYLGLLYNANIDKGRVDFGNI